MGPRMTPCNGFENVARPPKMPSPVKYGWELGISPRMTLSAKYLQGGDQFTFLLLDVPSSIRSCWSLIYWLKTVVFNILAKDCGTAVSK